MSRAYCECPHCCRLVPVKWAWEALRTAYLDGDDGEVVTDRGCLDATRVVYPRHIKCPNCGMRLRVEHELVPEFYASKEGCDGTD